MKLKNKKTIYDLKENESMSIESSALNGYKMEWIVQRVVGGWIYHEENPRITRTPMVVFVPFSTEFLSGWIGKKVILKSQVDVNDCVFENLRKNTVYIVTEESEIAIKVKGGKYCINKNQFNIVH